MSRMKGLVAAVLLVGACVGWAAGPPGVVADFTLKSRSGDNMRLADFRGQVVLLNFWASWCGPCRQEMPLLEDIYRQYGKYGFVVLAVNVEEQSAAADDFLATLAVTFPVLYDDQNVVSRQYAIDAMPTTVLLDRDGRQRYLHRGYQPGYEDEYRRQIKLLVRE